MTKTTGVLLFDQVEELDAVGPYEVFGMARRLRPDRFDVFLVAAQPDAITCVHGMKLLPDHALEDAPPIDVLLIPGGVGTKVAARDEMLLDWVRETADRAEWVASVCSGARVTLAAGLAEGRRITTHWGVIDELRRDGRAAEVLDGVRFVRDGRLVHSAGVSAGLDMSLWLVGEISGDASLVREIERQMDYRPSPPRPRRIEAAAAGERMGEAHSTAAPPLEGLLIRPAVEADGVGVARVVSEAFGRPDEATLVEALRANGDALLELVAEFDGAVVGHILFSPLVVERTDAPPLGAAALAPMAVRPDLQRFGVGGALVREGLRLCREAGLPAVVVLGHPNYYPRFGFSASLAARLRAPFSGPALMALELERGVLKEEGALRYAKAFGLSEAPA